MGEKVCKPLLALVAAIVFLFSLAMSPAHAYLDPGTGSILIQSLIAALAAGAYALKMYWFRIKTYFSKDSDSSEARIQGSGSKDPGEQ